MLPDWMIPQGVPNLWVFVGLGTLSAVLFSMAKSGFGASAGLLAVPLMIFATGDPATALGIMLPMLIMADYVAVVTWWRKWDLRQLLLLLPGTLGGVGVAWALMHTLRGGASSPGPNTDAWLKLGVGVIALGFVVLRVLKSLRGDALAFKPVAWQGGVAGATAGFTSTMAHAAGPVVAMYLLPQHMHKDRYVATTAMFFFIANQVKLVPYCSEGLLTTHTLGACVLMIPGVILGGVLAGLLHRRLSDRGFTAVVYVLLAAAGGQLIYEAVRALWA